MKCLLCKHVRRCQFEADYIGQVFDVNYDGEHGCADFTLMTKADHIRSLSDEELADFLIGVYIQDYWEHPNDITDWLKQPYGGAEHE